MNTEEEILNSSRIIAVVGLSPKPDRPSYNVANYLKENGYKIIPVNPKAGEILGEVCYPDLSSIPEPVDVVDIFRRSEEVPAIVEEAIKIRAKAVWMQEGVINEPAAARAAKAGLFVVMDRCMLKEHRKLERRRIMEEKKIKDLVRERYSQIASQEQQSCCSSCSCSEATPLSQVEAIGYLAEDLEHIPEETIMGLGCGNPIAITELKAGEVVLDLGSGAGIDVFLAANKVGPTGRVIGVDMTKEMVDKAKDIAKGYGYHNVEFRQGEIEGLPIDDKSVDVIISNCVINLSSDKSKVFLEACRVLKPGGRLIVSDIVAEKTLPDEIKQDPDAWVACIAGALEQQEYLTKIKKAGFEDVQVISKREFYIEGKQNKAMEKLLSITVKAYKRERSLS